MRLLYRHVKSKNIRTGGSFRFHAHRLNYCYGLAKDEWRIFSSSSRHLCSRAEAGLGFSEYESTESKEKERFPSRWLRLLQRTREYDEKMQVLEEGKEAVANAHEFLQTKISHMDLLKVLTSLLEYGQGDVASKVFESGVRKLMAKKNRSKSDVIVVYDHYIRKLSERGEVDKVRRLIDQMSKFGLHPGLSIYTYYIRVLELRGDYEAVEKIHRLLVVQGFRLDAKCLGLLLLSTVRSHKMDQAAKLLETINRGDEPPTKEACTGMFGLFRSQGNLGAALELFAQLEHRRAWIVNNDIRNDLMILMMRAGYWQQAIGVYDKIEKEMRVPASVSSMKMAAAALRYLGEEDRAFQMTEQVTLRMRNSVHPQERKLISGQTTQPATRNVSSAKALFRSSLSNPVRTEDKMAEAMDCLKVALSSKDVAFVMEIIDRVANSPLRPRLFFLDEALFLAAEKGNPKLCRRICDMKRRWAPINGFALYCLLYGYCRADQPELAEQLLRTSVEDYSVKAECRHFSSVILHYSMRGETERARELLVEMRHVGIEVTERTFHSLAVGYVQKGDSDAVEQISMELRDEGLQVNTITYNLLMKVYLKRRDLTAVMECWSAMRQEGLRPCVYSYSTLVACLAYCDRLVEAEQVVTHMINLGIRPVPATFDPILRCHVGQGAIEEAVRVYKQLRRTNVEPDLVLYRVLLQGLSHIGDLEHWSKLIEATDPRLTAFQFQPGDNS